MSLHTAPAEFASIVKPPSADDTPALVTQLVDRHGADWVDDGNVDAWTAGAGDRVLFFWGDPVRFPEGLDVAVVLPELQRSLPGPFAVGVARRAGQEAMARRLGSQRWPTLMFFRDGRYVGVVCGMLDWDVFLNEVRAMLGTSPSRMPGIGIPLVRADAATPGCH
jgi:hydrogenase-1 operon protein HyaE